MIICFRRPSLIVFVCLIFALLLSLFLGKNQLSHRYHNLKNNINDYDNDNVDLLSDKSLNDYNYDPDLDHEDKFMQIHSAHQIGDSTLLMHINIRVDEQRSVALNSSAVKMRANSSIDEYVPPTSSSSFSSLYDKKSFDSTSVHVLYDVKQDQVHMLSWNNSLLSHLRKFKKVYGFSSIARASTNRTATKRKYRDCFQPNYEKRVNANSRNRREVIDYHRVLFCSPDTILPHPNSKDGPTTEEPLEGPGTPAPHPFAIEKRNAFSKFFGMIGDSIQAMVYGIDSLFHSRSSIRGERIIYGDVVISKPKKDRLMLNKIVLRCPPAAIAESNGSFERLLLTHDQCHVWRRRSAVNVDKFSNSFNLTNRSNINNDVNQYSQPIYLDFDIDDLHSVIDIGDRTVFVARSADDTTKHPFKRRRRSVSISHDDDGDANRNVLWINHAGPVSGTFSHDNGFFVVGQQITHFRISDVWQHLQRNYATTSPPEMSNRKRMRRKRVKRTISSLQPIGQYSVSAFFGPTLSRGLQGFAQKVRAKRQAEAAGINGTMIGAVVAGCTVLAAGIGGLTYIYIKKKKNKKGSSKSKATEPQTVNKLLSTSSKKKNKTDAPTSAKMEPSAKQSVKLVIQSAEKSKTLKKLKAAETSTKKSLMKSKITAKVAVSGKMAASSSTKTKQDSSGKTFKILSSKALYHSNLVKPHQTMVAGIYNSQSDKKSFAPKGKTSKSVSKSFQSKSYQSKSVNSKFSKAKSSSTKSSNLITSKLGKKAKFNAPKSKAIKSQFSAKFFHSKVIAKQKSASKKKLQPKSKK